VSLAARRLSAGSLANASVALPPDVDPLRLLAAHPREPRLYFAQPATGLAIAAVGAATAAVAAGPHRFATLAARDALTAVRPDAAPPQRWTLTPATPPDAWRRRVAATVADIDAGRVGKVVLARAVRVTADAALDPLRVLARLRAAQPECTVFGVGHGGAFFVGATPERLARVTAGRLDTAAVAGTCLRGRGDALLASPKERAEHAFVVDALRRRLAPLAARLTIPDTPEVVGAGDVLHLRTPVTATLRPGRGLLDVVAALHPTPAVCGVPQDDALRLLARRERLARGWYAGGVGWVDAAGDGEIVVPLRCALLRGRQATLFAGAGIVAGSDPDAELEETRLKLRPLLGALLEL
jgi:isochorismate synthase